jgi:hypothetical protein
MMSFPEPGCARNLTNLIKINYEVDARVIIHEMYPVPSLGRAQSAFGCGRFANARTHSTEWRFSPALVLNWRARGERRKGR